MLSNQLNLPKDLKIIIFQWIWTRYGKIHVREKEEKMPAGVHLIWDDLYNIAGVCDIF